MDPHKELEDALRRIYWDIRRDAHWAVERIRDMYTVETGVCYCGSDMENHPIWDNHAPRDMRIDKSHG